MTNKPFIPLADIDRTRGRRLHADRLLIESEDIANIHLEAHAGAEGDWIDNRVKWLLLRLRLTKADDPGTPQGLDGRCVKSQDGQDGTQDNREEDPDP